MGLALWMIALGLYLASNVGFNTWQQYRSTYWFEHDQILQWPNKQAWTILIRAVLVTVLPFIGVAVLLTISRWIARWLIRRFLHPDSKQGVFWVACYQGQIIGRAVTIFDQHYTLLTTLYMAPEHRGQGVGSHLLWHCLQQANRPVYLVCHRQLQAFYRRLGFATASRLSVPDKLKYSLPKDIRMMKLSLPPLVPSPIAYLPFTPSQKWSVHLLKSWRAKLSVYRHLNKRKRFRRSRRQYRIQLGIMLITPFLFTNTVVYVLKHVHLFKVLQNFEIPVLPSLGLYVSSFSLAVLLITFLLCGLWLIFCRQEWIVKEGHRTIAYVRFSSYGRCTVLQQLHVEPQYPRLQMTQLLLSYFSRKVQFPLYVTCSKRDRRFYDKLGFNRIRRSTLPWEMKVMQWGKTISLKLSYDTVAKTHTLTNAIIPN